MRNVKKMSFSAIITAFSIILLYISSIIPTGKVAVFAMATAILCSVVIECGTRYAIVSAVCTGILCAILVPNKLIVIPYIVFFGYYPVLKLYIEKANKLIIEWVIKLSVAFIGLAISYFIVTLIIKDLIIPFSIYLIVIVSLVGFALYDFALSLFIKFYTERISKAIKIK